jgi:natural product precursor
MKTKKLKFQDFEADKLSKKEQKTVRGGDVPTEPDPIDPGKGTGKGNQ